MGEPIDPGVARRLAEIFERRPDVSPFEEALLNDVRERFVKFGLSTHVSVKQAAIVDQVYLGMAETLGEDDA